MAMRANQANEAANETVAPLHECVPDDPQPVAAATAQKPSGAIEQSSPVSEKEFEEVTPIVIHEEEPAPAAPPTVVLNERNFDIDDMQKQEVPSKGCPTVMPHCQDDDGAPATPPASAGAETEQNVFKAWMDLFTEGKEEKNAPAAEELPPPAEEQPQAEPKCQEDSHLHEHYPGCPRTSSPFIGKERMANYFKRVWDLNSKLKKKGGEESSEEPPHSGKDCKDKEECPRTKGVDTMEYRKSDAGPDEYGPGQVH
jgi:hypothetical protein